MNGCAPGLSLIERLRWSGKRAINLLGVLPWATVMYNVRTSQYEVYYQCCMWYIPSHAKTYCPHYSANSHDDSKDYHCYIEYAPVCKNKSTLNNNENHFLHRHNFSSSSNLTKHISWLQKKRRFVTTKVTVRKEKIKTIQQWLYFKKPGGHQTHFTNKTQ